MKKVTYGTVDDATNLSSSSNNSLASHNATAKDSTSTNTNSNTSMHNGMHNNTQPRDDNDDPDLFDWLRLSVRTSLSSDRVTPTAETPRTVETSRRSIGRACTKTIALTAMAIALVLAGGLWVRFRTHRRPAVSSSLVGLRAETNTNTKTKTNILTSCPVPFTDTVLSVPDCSDYSYLVKDAHRNTISSWHDVPLEEDTYKYEYNYEYNYNYNYSYYNMVVEIPKMTRARLRCQTHKRHTPIQHERTSTFLLKYFPGPIYWNYGFLPQTWNSPLRKQYQNSSSSRTTSSSSSNTTTTTTTDEVHNTSTTTSRSTTGTYFGDGDPLDVLEIGTEVLPTGTIQPIKILGALLLIDRGIADWKIIGIAQTDPMADQWESIRDVPLSVQYGIREWFRWYRMPAQGLLNSFFGNDENDYYLPSDEAQTVVARANDDYHELLLQQQQQQGNNNILEDYQKRYWFPPNGNTDDDDDNII